MKRLIDLNSGSLFEDTRGMVGSAPYKLGEQRRQVWIFFICFIFLYLPLWLLILTRSCSLRQLSIMKGSCLILSIIDQYSLWRETTGPSWVPCNFLRLQKFMLFFVKLTSVYGILWMPCLFSHPLSITRDTYRTRSRNREKSLGKSQRILTLGAFVKTSAQPKLKPSVCHNGI